jgi:hypothetical protein
MGNDLGVKDKVYIKKELYGMEGFLFFSLYLFSWSLVEQAIVQHWKISLTIVSVMIS